MIARAVGAIILVAVALCWLLAARDVNEAQRRRYLEYAVLGLLCFGVLVELSWFLPLP